jgi:hypothetical protein
MYIIYLTHFIIKYNRLNSAEGPYRTKNRKESKVFLLLVISDRAKAKE